MFYITQKVWCEKNYLEYKYQKYITIEIKNTKILFYVFNYNFNILKFI